jgi:hypothetical protein
MKNAVSLTLVVCVSAGMLAGCQSVQQSAANASYTCEAAGLQPGTRKFDRCHNAVFAQNRAQSDQAAAAAATAAAAGVIGGAVIGAAASRPHYRYYGPYRPYPYYRPYYYW